MLVDTSANDKTLFTVLKILIFYFASYFVYLKVKSHQARFCWGI